MPINEALAAKWYRKAAQQGHVKAMVNLALSLAGGKGCGKNESEAAFWFEKAAERGDLRAQRMIASCFADGRGVVQDHSKSVAWYHKAAKQNDTNSQFNLGICYQEGRGVQKDPHKAAKWYWRSANLGNTQAMYNLGCCYSEGFGVPEDPDKATRWFAEAASRGYAPTVMDPKYPTPKALPSAEADVDSADNDNANQFATDSVDKASPKDPDGSVGNAQSNEGSRVAQLMSTSSDHTPSTSTQESAILDCSMGTKKQLRAVKLRPLEQEAASQADGAPITSPEKLLPSTVQNEKKAVMVDKIDKSKFTDTEKKLFPGLTGSVSPPKDEEQRIGVPKSILKDLEKINGHTQKGAIQKDSVDLQLIGNGQGMKPAEQGMRVQLAPNCKGNAVSGEMGTGTIMWVGNQGQVCHVRWDGTTRFDYSYCVGHNGFHDLCVAPNETDKVVQLTDDATSWTVHQVGQFLEGHRQSFGGKTDLYIQAFEREDIDGKTLMKLTKEELQELGISLGHRKLLLDEINRMQAKIKADLIPAFSGQVIERAPLREFRPTQASNGKVETRDEKELLDRQLLSEQLPQLQRLLIPGQKDETRQMSELYGGVHPSAENSGLYEAHEEAAEEGSGVSLFKRRMMAAKKAAQ